MVSIKSPTQKYEELISIGKLKRDVQQYVILNALDALNLELIKLEKKQSFWFGNFGRVLSGQKLYTPKGLYIWGGVGRGKTHLMDIFFDLAPIKKKRRTHFHNFMRDVHNCMNDLRKNTSVENLPKYAAKIFSEQFTLLCFDEMELKDIADAMIIYRFFNSLWNMGVIVVATSNRPPKDLYKNGLHRERVIPFLKKIEENCNIYELKGENDFRQIARKDLQGWFYPLSKANSNKLKSNFIRLTGNKKGIEEFIPSAGREIEIPMAVSGVALIHFNDLCKKNLSARDYIEVASRYRGVLLDGIPILDDQNRNEARRFIWLIDALYDAGCFVICCSEKPIERIYDGNDWSFEFERTTSRLTEMSNSQKL